MRAAPIDFKAVAERADLRALIVRELGEPERGGKWSCPFHPDRTPSMGLIAHGRRFRCYGCNATGDALEWIMRRGGVSIVEAARRLDSSIGSDYRPHVEAGSGPRESGPAREARARPDGWVEFARALVSEAEDSLWSVAGTDALAYLRGRGLTEATIRSARLGLVLEDRRVGGVFEDKPLWVPRGVVIPWYEDGDPIMVNVRRPDGVSPKYWAIRGSRRGGAYPSRTAIQAGRPLAVVEGEFESLLLGQDLSGLVSVVTFGGAGVRPKGRALDGLLSAAPWLVAVDFDGAGEGSAAAWLSASSRCRRVRPPSPHKDWTEAAQAGVPLRRWWGDLLGGNPSPPLFNWDELAAMRWGPAVGDPSPGIVIDLPDRGRQLAALEATLPARRDPGASPEPLGRDIAGSGRP